MKINIRRIAALGATMTVLATAWGMVSSLVEQQELTVAFVLNASGLFAAMTVLEFIHQTKKGANR